MRLPSDLSTDIEFSDAANWGIGPDDLVADDYGPCQALADRLRTDAGAPKAIRVPSAALPGTRNLVIFGERVSIPYQWTPVDAIDVPASVVAAYARPPAELFPLIRHPGAVHAELAAWLRGEAYRFADLETAP
jgi:hypothetical protein